MSDINYICRWRDAITDPPSETWRGRSRINGTIRPFTAFIGGWVWSIDAQSTSMIKAQPGDQWLDVTDVPAVAVSKVQAAVDQIQMAIDLPAETAVQEAMDLGFDAALATIRNHTGVTPSGVQ
jgi:hypothetical protein